MIVEDSFAAIMSLRTQLERAIGPDGQQVGSVQVLDHAAALDPARELTGDVYLVDARRHPNERLEAPAQSSFGGLLVAQRVADAQPAAIVVGYSARASAPEINIAFREVPVVRAVYDHAVLVDHVAEALWSAADHQVAPPGAGDYASLGLLPGAQLWAALQVAMSRHDTWEAVARIRPERAIENRTRQFLNMRLRDLLPTPEPVTYRFYVDLLRRVAGFEG